MKRSDLIAAIAAESGCSKKDVDMQCLKHFVLLRLMHFARGTQ